MNFRREWIWPFVIMLTVFTVSGQSQVAVPRITLPIPMDKLVHFAVFGAFATSLIRIEAFRSRGWRGVLWVCLIVSAFGAMDEWRQSFTPRRSVEVADWVADTLGGITASVLYRGWPGYRRLLEWRPFPR